MVDTECFLVCILHFNQITKPHLAGIVDTISFAHLFIFMFQSRKGQSLTPYLFVIQVTLD